MGWHISLISVKCNCLGVSFFVSIDVHNHRRECLFYLGLDFSDHVRAILFYEFHGFAHLLEFDESFTVSAFCLFEF